MQRPERKSGAYGRGVIELEEEQVAQGSLRDQLSAELLSALRAPGYTPPVLPAAALQVHHLSRARDVKPEKILHALERDPLLAARVVRAASSPAFGGLAIHSLQAAIMRIGMSNLSELVWEVALNMCVFRSRAFEGPMNALRKHSSACAHVCRTIAKFTAVPLEYAFLCGLLHDVGAAAALHLLGEEGATLPNDLLDLVLGAAHAEASQLVATLWQLPDDVQLVLGHHHAVVISGFVHPTAAIIGVAEQLLDEVGGSFAGLTASWDERSEHTFARSCDALHLNQATLGLIKGELEPLLARLERSY